MMKTIIQMKISSNTTQSICMNSGGVNASNGRILLGSDDAERGGEELKE